MAGRDGALTAALVRMVDTLVVDYDPVELTQELVDTSVDLLPADAAGLLLADGHGDLQVFASTSEESRLLELLQVESAAGPCLQAYRTGEQVLVEDLEHGTQRWPAFAERAALEGFRGVCALPLRLRNDRIGALNLFTTRAGVLGLDEVRIGQALADFATIGIVHARILADSLVLNDQLNIALNSRVVIEQAKGMLAERAHLDMDTAFGSLRKYARDTNQRLADVSRALVDHGVTLEAILEHQVRK
ncbi:ANTAR domain-containing protein [Nocardia sp. SYP-A9097]|uniref:GAF and ANTAR domain-containing protein n=1 Tax=Nocardia sp. SYP-A9097 TaxID=2663237 RepID=UPI00129B7A50|nr:GAF and ANTAR domain-containing protein [Nocardia sp. SYP-A9097]MRH89265.1 ANTAR domain-containing protein [Nocardia sp. SYP-A9097]